MKFSLGIFAKLHLSYPSINTLFTLVWVMFSKNYRAQLFQETTEPFLKSLHLAQIGLELRATVRLLDSIQRLEHC